MLLFFLISSCLLSGHLIIGHVRLQYPVARNFQLDGTGDRWTIGACGMPRDLPATDLKAGSTFNVTWFLGATHEGGIRVELLDVNYNLLSLLVPLGGGSDDWYGLNPAPTMQEVTLPNNVTCQNCVIRVLKLGDKHVVPEDYIFNSCADVNVVNQDVIPKCSGRGQWTGSICQCQKPFVGDSCQYADECFDDSDCSGHGSCVDTQAQSYPKKQCYCVFGWHGLGCKLESPLKTPDFKPENYMKRESRFSNFTFYWRILEDIGEIEGVIVAKAKNWVAVGWRPTGGNTSCRDFPVLKPDVITTVAADGTTVQTVVDFMDKSTIYYTIPLHPMACHDIIMIGTRGNLSRFHDTYTRDHSSPSEDEVYGGTYSITAAVAYEDPATSTVVALFRKKLIANEPADVSISSDGMHVMWAIGQEPYDPSAHVGNTPTQPLDHDEILKEFPRKGELNSHAHNAKNRGHWDPVNMHTGL